MDDKKSLRLQVFLSRSGVCSRRKAMHHIQNGEVTLNGVVVKEPSTPVDLKRDEVFFHSQKISLTHSKYILLYKPAGVVTTKSDRFAEKTVIDFLPSELKDVHPVGRLDKDTEGLLLLTNDGDLTFQLTHPKHEIEKTYEIRVKGILTDTEINKLKSGVVIDGKKTYPAKVFDVMHQKDATWFKITIHEGRNRQIRKMCEEVKHPVISLKRIAEGSITLGSLKKGTYRHLTDKEVQSLKKHTD